MEISSFSAVPLSLSHHHVSKSRRNSKKSVMSVINPSHYSILWVGKITGVNLGKRNLWVKLGSAAAWSTLLAMCSDLWGDHIQIYQMHYMPTLLSEVGARFLCDFFFICANWVTEIILFISFLNQHSFLFWYFVCFLWSSNIVILWFVSHWAEISLQKLKCRSFCHI